MVGQKKQTPTAKTVAAAKSASPLAWLAAIGLLAGQMTATELSGGDWTAPPRTTALGALLSHVTGDAEAATYQPMNVNFGLFPPLGPEVKKKQRKEGYTARGKADLDAWLNA